MSLPAEDKARKALPIWDGVVMYFPDALAAVAEVSRLGNEQHNPGEKLHWAREKSTDQMNTALRHMIDHGQGNYRDTGGAWHLAKAIWRLCAELQLTIEQNSHALAPDAPRRATTAPEKGCGHECPSGPVHWSCERQHGHTGNHMAWSDYPTTLYSGGEWA